MTAKIYGKGSKKVGQSPSIILANPRFSHNVGMVVRLASCYGLKQVWFTGNRVRLDLDAHKRLPREERMKGYRDVDIIQFDRPLEQFQNVTPVAVEVRENSERLQYFDHPKNAVYIFGPEDGSIPQGLLRNCHRFVLIPTKQHYCLNLATAVSTILWDRVSKLNEVPEVIDDDTPMYFEDTNPKDIGLFNEFN